MNLHNYSDKEPLLQPQERLEESPPPKESPVRRFSHAAKALFRRKKDTPLKELPVPNFFQRKTTGPEFTAQIDQNQFFGELRERVERFTDQNDLIERKALFENGDKIEKVRSILVQSIEVAIEKGDERTVVELSQKLEQIYDIFVEVQKLQAYGAALPKATLELTEEANYEFLVSYMDNLIELLQIKFFENHHISDSIDSLFHIDYVEALTAEVLALYMAYLQNLDGKTIALPVFNESTKLYEKAVFHIELHVLGEELPCYLLRPENTELTPWLVIRGTEGDLSVTAEGENAKMGAAESLFADFLDPSGQSLVDFSSINQPMKSTPQGLVQMQSINQVLQEMSDSGHKVNVCGHSLGGSLSALMAVRFFDKLNHVYSFSGPGVSEETKKEWDSLNAAAAAQGSHTPQLVSFDYQGDFIPTAGHKLIGRHFALQSLTKPRNFVSTHGLGHLHQHNFRIAEVDVDAENEKYEYVVASTVRAVSGPIVSTIIQTHQNREEPKWHKHKHVVKAITQDMRKESQVSERDRSPSSERSPSSSTNVSPSSSDKEN